MRLTNLIILIGLCITPLDMQAVVVLSEVMFDPAGDESTDEFVELYNDAALPVQLAGWTISDGEGIDTLVSTGEGLTAAPRQYILILDPDYIEDGSISYDGLVPENALIVTIGGNNFGSRGFSNSSGESVSLRNASGSLVGEYIYSTGNESGHSDEKIRVTAGDDSVNWHDSESPLGTPGFRNSVTPPDRDLGILSINFVPDYPPIGSAYQISVLIKNLGLQPLGATLSLSADSSGDGQLSLIRRTELATIAAGDSTSITDSTTMPDTGIEQLRADLEITDEDSNNNTMTVLASSEAIEAGLRINEIQYAPVTGRAEWIELAVAGTLPVSTRGIKMSDGQGTDDTTARVQLPDWVLQAGEFAVVSTDSAVLLENMPFEARVAVLNPSDVTLNNNGDSILIFTPSGEILDRVDYRPNWGADESGVSLERVSLASATNVASNWGSSVDAQGSTPGRVNSRSILQPQSTPSLSVSPSPFTPNGDGVDDVTEILYSTSFMDGYVTIKIFDAHGRLVRRFGAQAQNNAASVLWDGKRDNGDMAATSRYIVLLEAEDGSGEVSQERTTVILARPK